MAKCAGKKKRAGGTDISSREFGFPFIRKIELQNENRFHKVRQSEKKKPKTKGRKEERREGGREARMGVLSGKEGKKGNVRCHAMRK